MLGRFRVALKMMPIGSWLAQDVRRKDGSMVASWGEAVTEELAERLKSADVEGSVLVCADMGSMPPDAVSAQKGFALNPEILDTVNEMAERISSGVLTDDFVPVVCEAADIIREAVITSSSVFLCIDALQQYDYYSYKHSVNVSLLASLIARSLELPDDMVHNAAMAGILHDIGKSKVPLSILNGEKKLTDEEFEIIKRHPQDGYDMIKDAADIPDEVKEAVLAHHEKWGGGGYPSNLVGKDIPLLGRILAVADIYDALVSKRTYKDPILPYKAVQIMREPDRRTGRSGIDESILHGLLSCLELFPVKSHIKLSDGSSGLVVRQNEGYPYSPCVMLTGVNRVVDLLHDPKYRDIRVETILTD